MVAGSITDEVTVSVPVERLWRVAFADTESVLKLLPKACAGFVESVEVDGDGGHVGSVTTIKLNPSLSDVKVLKSRVLTFDAAARAEKTEVLQGDPLSAELKKQEAEFKMEAAGEGATVFKVKVDYERIDGAALAPEDGAKLTQGYIGFVKMIEAYLVAHPDEFP